jgi:hypothetical protein
MYVSLPHTMTQEVMTEVIPKVKMTRPATGALRRLQHGSKTRGGTSSKEEAHRLVAASWVKPGTSTFRDGRRSPA